MKIAIYGLSIVGTLLIFAVGLIYSHHKTLGVWLTFAVFVAYGLAFCLYWQDSILEKEKLKSEKPKNIIQISPTILEIVEPKWKNQQDIKLFSFFSITNNNPENSYYSVWIKINSLINKLSAEECKNINIYKENAEPSFVQHNSGISIAYDILKIWGRDPKGDNCVYFNLQKLNRREHITFKIEIVDPQNIDNKKFKYKLSLNVLKYSDKPVSFLTQGGKPRLPINTPENISVKGMGIFVNNPGAIPKE